MTRSTLTFAAILLVPLAPAAGQAPPAERQIEWALSPAPEKLRADATVLGYAKSGDLVTLRKGTGLLVCLADDPKQANHHVACYHRDLDPFMAVGRELRARGLKDPAIDSARKARVEAGSLKMPPAPAALYQLIGPPGSANLQTGEVTGARALYVIYTPFATSESTGLPLAPGKGVPWLMDPGLPWAHVMITP